MKRARDDGFLMVRLYVSSFFDMDPINWYMATSGASATVFLINEKLSSSKVYTGYYIRHIDF